MSLCELLDEAILEQESHVPENKLMIYDRIIDFRNYMVENYTGHTIANSVSKIKTFYHYNRVHIPFIPPLNVKSVRKNDAISYDELLTRDELRDAMCIADDNLRLWILVMLSSGSSRAEAKSMTNETFFKGTQSYHCKDDFCDALKYLSLRDNVVCTCRMIRSKTDTPYYTFLNPECVQEIARVKLKQRDYDLDSPLLKYGLNHVNYKFKQINDMLGLGTVGGFSKFRPHMIRKFNASHLNHDLDMDLVDLLHGRGKSKTRKAYFKDNPLELKLKYVEAMNNISLYRKYNYTVVGGEIKIRSKPI
ncbi:MAG: hypothetical protein Q4Q37_09655 [Methanobrevibacter sp.]|nr:hypothetical protein [Methanobrevibacter sp.]